MAQDFYFKFFAREFLTSKEVRAMSLQDQAILVRLWCVCCLEGVLPEDMEELSMVSGVKQMHLQTFEHLFEQFFERDSTGHRYSPRMELEREKSIKVREERSNAGKASGLARKAKSEMNKCSNICSNSHSHIKKEKSPQPGEKNIRPYVPLESSSDAGFTALEGCKHSRSAGLDTTEARKHSRSADLVATDNDKHSRSADLDDFPFGREA